jgi:hypothetical protein
MLDSLLGYMQQENIIYGIYRVCRYAPIKITIQSIVGLVNYLGNSFREILNNFI